MDSGPRAEESTSMRFQTGLTPEMLDRYTRSGYWRGETCYDILSRRAAAHPDRVAIVDRGRRITYRDLKARVDRVAAHLGALGIGAGDVITIQLPNWAEFAFVFFAAEHLGAVANQIGPDFRIREVEYIIRFSESRAYVCPARFKGFDYVAMIEELRAKLPDLKIVAVLGGGGRAGTFSLDELLAGDPEPPTAPPAATSLIAMRNEPGRERRDLASLRVVITGGASCPVETIREYRARMQGQLIELDGMLETGFHTYTRLTDEPEAVSGTVGRPASGMGLRLIDDQGRDVAPGAEGEIGAHGPSVHLGYHKNPVANTELFTVDGWFRTGDLGQFDAAGNLKIVGRLKEMINRGGKKFFPREIEEILYTHPKILHAAIVGVPDPRLGERNCLCVIPRAGAAITLEEVVAFLRNQVATYKLPEMLEVVDELPFTPTGKIQRYLLSRRILERRAG